MLGEMNLINKLIPQRLGWELLVAGAVIVLISLLAFMWQWRPSVRKRKALERKLNEALNTVRDLEDKLIQLDMQKKMQERSGKLAGDSGDIGTNGSREIRIWMDGAFDMMHYGHMNAFRQGRSLGTYLIVGVNSDETITACKGKPVCAERERVETVRGCKWVDEVVEGVPYVMNDEYLTYIIEKYRIDYVVHGDDPCIVDGKDVYESAVKMGKYLTIPRTEGISTTDIVGRMLLMTRSHHTYHNSSNSNKMKKRNSSSRSGSFDDTRRAIASAVGIGGDSNKINSSNSGSNDIDNDAVDESNNDGSSDKSSSDDESTADFNLASGRRHSSSTAATTTTTTAATTTTTTAGSSSPQNKYSLNAELTTTITDESDIGHKEEASTGVSPTVAVTVAAGSGSATSALRNSRPSRPFIRKSRFLTTSRFLRLFGSGVQAPKEGDRVVYVAGAWDMLHAGHVNILHQARQLGDYLIVGVFNDTIVNEQRGLNFPILSLHERVLSVLGCKYVNDVLIDAPREITQELLLTLKIDVVVRGSFMKTPLASPASLSRSNSGHSFSIIRNIVSTIVSSGGSGGFAEAEVNNTNTSAAGTGAGTEGVVAAAGGGAGVGVEPIEVAEEAAEESAYVLPKKLGLLREVQCSMGMSVLDMVERIQEQREKFAEKYKKKASAENQFYKDKYNL